MSVETVINSFISRLDEKIAYSNLDDDGLANLVQLKTYCNSALGSTSTGGESGTTTVNAPPSIASALVKRTVTLTQNQLSLLAPSKTDRKYLFIQNAADTGILYMDISGEVNDNSGYRLEPKQSLVFEGSFIPNNAIWVRPTADMTVVCFEG